MNHRPPAVAGTFYPADPTELQTTVKSLLEEHPASRAYKPRALIVPHAGYVFSGPVAAAAYNLLNGGSNEFSQILLLGPAHRAAVNGIAYSGVTAYQTPLGEVAVATETVQQLASLRGGRIDDLAHAEEHCLEVQLPFLQHVLNNFKIVPGVVGRVRPEVVTAAISTVWGPETLILISSDLSHFLSEDEAKKIDGSTSRSIESLNSHEIGYNQACGAVCIQALLNFAQSIGLEAEVVSQATSADAFGDTNRVVGYGAYAFH